MGKRISLVASCECGHAGMWHKPDCRIRDCDCTEFVHAVARRADGTWVDPQQQGRPK
jgi:hypothetical protein